VIAKKDFMDILVANVENREMTVVISSHHLHELEKICDDVTLIHKGKVQVSNTILEAKQNIRKFQAVFSEGAPNNLTESDDVLDCKNTGSIYTIIVMNKKDRDWIKELDQIGASYVEECDVDLEEMFIYLNREGEKL
jgi:ABC-2 type transport system ATP-binding protein